MVETLEVRRAKFQESQGRADIIRQKTDEWNNKHTDFTALKVVIDQKLNSHKEQGKSLTKQKEKANAKLNDLNAKIAEANQKNKDAHAIHAQSIGLLKELDKNDLKVIRDEMNPEQNQSLRLTMYSVLALKGEDQQSWEKVR